MQYALIPELHRSFEAQFNKMASNFSGALQLTDLNDFITPSQVDFPFDCLYFVVSNLLRCYAC